MSEIERQRIKFTAKRTGMDAAFIPGFGVIRKGQVIELDKTEADRWTADLPVGDDQFQSDWSPVGDSFTRTDDEVVEANQRVREHLIDNVAPAPPEKAEKAEAPKDDKPASAGKTEAQ
jgi:hypothetical protein